VKLWCGKCCEEFKRASGDHNKFIICNLFANLKKKSCNVSKKRCRFFAQLQFVVPKGKQIVFIIEDHKKVGKGYKNCWVY
jgi:hypothetical protein